ncbi:MAG: class I SAM-dependent DNA methyltransferase [Niveispirillum sp.]|uniref:class I SAM-dependent DNA methyltransferase n=1 Tax=Niveispirillum sp. TaxID=1917217 RepID=UPI003BA45F14
MNAEKFIEYWSGRGGSERANYQKFINELCELIGVDKPEASHAEDHRNEYVFEKRVRAMDVDGEDGRYNFIDCYKRKHFVLEAKQSDKRMRGLPVSGPDLFGDAPPVKAAPKAAWDRMMKQARQQAENYAKYLPEWPPFLLIVDVGHVIEVYADFTGLGKRYKPFPDSRSHRIGIPDLADAAVRERLKAIWTDPQSLDPAAKRAEVTKDIAYRLARMARTLERRHDPKEVALFLMRCLFTAFAEDVGLLPADAFLSLLRKAEGNPQFLPRYLTPFWKSMDKGSDFDPMIGAPVRHFNGGLFKNAQALPLNDDELSELITACQRDWRNVEPAIFGTLLENALSVRERGQLGAHFTPRAYVERLVIPTVIEPLQDQWRATLALAEGRRAAGDEKGAVELIRAFHRDLCQVRVLDPACGTGNFLYVSLELMKELEGEVLLALEELGAAAQALLDLQGTTVGPQQFIGLEKNARAVPIAELVLWLGHLQGHLRLRGPESLSDPILKPVETVRQADAVLAWKKEELVLDEAGRPITRWDGVSMRTDPHTGRQVPDENRVVELKNYTEPKPAPWPKADFIVGNPPFIGGKDLRQELGDGYAEALWKAYPQMPGGADFVMYWWDRAADQVREGKARRFGFITTNSITQTFSRRVIKRHLDAKKPLHLSFAIPDHPWADAHGAAAVRVAMTVGLAGTGEGLLKQVVAEGEANPNDGAIAVSFAIEQGIILPDLTIGADIAGVQPLKANEGLSSRGVSLHGSGFIVTPTEAAGLGLGKVSGLEQHIRHYRNGRDLTGKSRGKMVIDLFGLTAEQVRQRFPAVYQWILDKVKPERDLNNEQYRRENWWLFGRKNTELRAALTGLPRYIATVETAKHRIFQFLDIGILPDNKLIGIGLYQSVHLGLLSSRIHTTWALAAGGLLEDRPVYVKSACFDAFPFPILTPAQETRIGTLAEELDGLRKKVDTSGNR